MRQLLIAADKKWLLCWSLIYGGFLGMAAFWPEFWGVAILRYTGVALVLIFAYEKFRNDYALQLALAVTLLADTILLVNNVSLIGVMVFCVAQLLHTLRFYRMKMRNLWWYVGATAMVMFAGAINLVEPIFAAASVYGITLGLNIYLAWKWYKERPRVGSKCALIGFVLFACCDVCVVASYFSFIHILPAIVYPFANYFAWAFYYPSQIFIANGSKLNKTMLQ